MVVLIIIPTFRRQGQRDLEFLSQNKNRSRTKKLGTDFGPAG